MLLHRSQRCWPLPGCVKFPGRLAGSRQTQTKSVGLLCVVGSRPNNTCGTDRRRARRVIVGTLIRLIFSPRLIAAGIVSLRVDRTLRPSCRAHWISLEIETLRCPQTKVVHYFARREVGPCLIWRLAQAPRPNVDQRLPNNQDFQFPLVHRQAEGSEWSEFRPAPINRSQFSTPAFILYVWEEPETFRQPALVPR